MRRAALALLLLLPAQDDLEKKVRELVEKLDALPPEALPLLRKAREKASTEAAARLDESIARIEARVRLAEAMGKPALVTIQAEKRPLTEVAAELAKQSGRVIEVEKARSEERRVGKECRL